MTIKQISLFLENRFGRLSELLTVLSKANIHIVSTMVADTSDFGILRIITSDQAKAFKVLRENNVLATERDVVAIAIQPLATQFAEVADLFTKRGINIEYLYCFNLNNQLVLVMSCDNLDAAREVIRNNNLNYITDNDLMRM